MGNDGQNFARCGLSRSGCRTFKPSPCFGFAGHFIFVRTTLWGETVWAPHLKSLERRRCPCLLDKKENFTCIIVPGAEQGHLRAWRLRLRMFLHRTCKRNLTERRLHTLVGVQWWFAEGRQEIVAWAWIICNHSSPVTSLQHSWNLLPTNWWGSLLLLRGFFSNRSVWADLLDHIKTSRSLGKVGKTLNALLTSKE